MTKREQAVELLQHYIALGMPTGKLSADGFTEVESIVDLIIDAAVEKMKRRADRPESAAGGAKHISGGGGE